MRYVRRFSVILLLLLLLVIEGVEVLAINTGFSTEELSEKDISTFITNMNISLLVDEPPKATIECFDVSENEMIAIGHSASDKKTISIYSDAGTFLYGYEFNCNGNFGIEWDADNLIIYFVRSDIAASVNPAGKIECVLKIQNTADNNSYWNKFVFSTKRSIRDTEYTLKNNMGVFNIFTSSYSQLVATNNGIEHVVYDVNATQFAKTIVVFISVLILICIVVFILIFQFAKILKHKAHKKT